MIMVSKDQVNFLYNDTEKGMLASRSVCYRKVSRYKTVVCLFVVIVAAILITLGCLSERFCLRENTCELTPVQTPDSLQLCKKLKEGSPRKKLPEALIIGVRKAGTGAMRFYLDMHPYVEIANAEISFFDFEYENGYEWYKNQLPMAMQGQLTMEKTSNYFHNKKTVDRIYNMSSAVKLIVVVREPIERTVSDYLQRKLKKSENDDIEYPKFEDFVIDQTTGEVDGSEKIIKPSIYYKHLLKWLKYFPLENLHFVDGGNLILNPYEEVKKVERFLGIPHCMTQDKFVFSSTKGFYCVKKNKGRREETKCLPETKGRRHPLIDPVVMRKLKDFFRPWNEKFYRAIGRSFHW
ncbi:heparan sulfate glucosamine 3-O-sulfotransferase 1-like [Mizuhopecten yessoensis]|uniref:Heparan sulfate glucosamine 3-O-sulfotransferase 5 n=1 Tax=Mizuhopecten yessoensis TaxID=6573 RepID=A0A210QKW5_MIZYE|nr:heparan sulfate glucosamine 3-O-sulfotransferase 1-like [Mizuhopecten yessoensis]XP_021355797.1 heparan sulfate glucosamine 3-O-sulfotransferase 1-like [Mizuhopecten yessoensis]XP_021355799.1 heparan sulfate glucosamine 3-O-sulfotransferase 1-like [Mizuhopecten yessoensis]XP_021355800.1 heparan sulfate glucosamine 3-O-sulfotransferase 1-like [Mizuhopecten yessoensis]XP_021355801.1 heparan sulfate glucosamine 3-O-sulfotransferase 1-like [Mizuhopecten yessoensis]XP_021355802.1 heparan sulfate